MRKGIILSLLVLIYTVGIYYAISYNSKDDDELYFDPSAISVTGFCGVDYGYGTADIYFKSQDTLKININFVFFVDSLSEDIRLDRCDRVIENINEIYKHGRILARKNSVEIIQSPEKKRDMPSFVRHGIELHKGNAVTCFVYDNVQDNFSDDLKYVAGLSKGISSNWFAVRDMYLHTTTTSHEFGHCLGLKHVDTPDETDGYNIVFGDKVCDTPSETRLYEKVDPSCAYIGDREFTTIEKQKLTSNIMGWIPEACRKEILPGQFAKMRYEIHNNTDLRNAVYNLNELQRQ